MTHRPSTQQANLSRIIREAMEKAIVWVDKDGDDMSGDEWEQKNEDLRLALGILHKWREEEAE